MAADLEPGTRLSNAQRERLAEWTSLAQWIGTDKAPAAIAAIEKVWPGYGPTAAGSILNAYYTDQAVVETTWAWLTAQGVTHGHGFEPGCGRGSWMTAAPDGVSFDGIDIDPISARIAGLLSGQHTAVARIEQWDLAQSPTAAGNGGYDLVVGNVPFSSTKPGRNNPHRDSLHNLAVLRSVEMIRPGGVATVITSRYALDARGNRGWRERLAEHVDLVAAIRLPSNTHREAGTAVVTDLLILRRPHDTETRPTADWIDTTTFTIDGRDFVHNTHFAEHPERVLGDYRAGGAWSDTAFSVYADRPAADQLGDVLDAIDVDYSPAGSAPRTPTHRDTTATGRALPAGSIVLDPTSDTGFSRDGTEHRCPKNQRAALGALCELRDRTLEYLDAPTEEGRAELLDRYVVWRDQHGPLNDYQVRTSAKTGKTRRDYPSWGGFRRDPSWWNVAALEVFDDDTHVGEPAPMLRRDTIATEPVWPTTAETLTQAVSNSMARHLHIDQDYVADQLDTDTDTARRLLVDVAFENPTSGRWEIAPLYLSGDVVTKLADARTAAADDPHRWGRNVAALTAALPTPLTPAEIRPELGVTWLTAADLTEFVHDHTGSTGGQVLYHPPSGVWSTHGYGAPGPADFRTTRYGMLDQVVRAANAAPVTVMKKVGDGDSERTVVDQEATDQEQLCRDNINEALVTWCWSDPERSTRLCARYNEMFNRYQAVEWDGSHLTLPGLAADFVPRPHQKDVVWRILTTGDTGTLMAHGVGAGKTAAMVIASQEARRSGRVPGTTMFAVLGSTVEQFARDYLRLYPTARVITPQKTRSDQKVSEMVAEFAARVATGDFDAAICSHEALASIPLTPDAQAAQLERRIGDFAAAPVEDHASRQGARRIQKQLDSFRNKLDGLADAIEDPTITYFDRLPVGMLFVDEAHTAKNIALMSARKGLPMPTPAQRAEGILARADFVRERHGDGAVVMATATPVTNSPAEMWTFARLVSPRSLDKAGIEHFDAFAANFLSPVDSVEHTADGKLKLVTRLAEYRNFPDLARMFRSFADVRATDQLGFKLPELAGGQATVHLAEPTEQQLTVTDWATERVAGHHLHLPNDVNDPIVAILSTTRAAALHPATISADTCAKWATRSHPNLRFSWDEPNPKLVEVADTVADIYHRTANTTYPGSTALGAAQAVFCDQGTPSADGSTSVYSVLTDLMVERGVDRNHIAWSHDWKPGNRQPLWDDVRNGNIRVLIGSTAHMGVGVNIQTRLAATHEITAPYRPDQLTQAEGRMIRQGNHHDTVELHRYITEHTADATSWQILERKARFIDVAMSHPDDLTRDLRDESIRTTAEEYAEISALATGDQRHIELASLIGTVDRLERAERAWAASRTAQDTSIHHNERTIARAATQIAALETLTPDTDVDAADIGQHVLAIPHGNGTVVTLAGVEWTATRSDDGIRLDIADTGIGRRIEREQLHPADGGRGLGTIIVNAHNRIGDDIARRHDTIATAQRQIDAEHERPVADHFPRRAELDTARHRRDELTNQLSPNRRRSVDDTGADPNEHDPNDPYLGRTPTDAERVQWAAPYLRYNPNTVPHWGNRAKGLDDWVAAVNTWATDPRNHRPNAVTQIGQVHGVMLAARNNGTELSIAPNRHHDRYNTLTTPPGELTANTVTHWLSNQHQRAHTEHTNHTTRNHGIDHDPRLDPGTGPGHTR